MLKVLFIIVLIFVGQILAAGLTCSSCGSECVSACGTRRFRICCFNHLKKKRGFPPVQMEEHREGEPKVMVIQKAVFIIEDPELWSQEATGARSYSRMNRTY